MGALREAVRRVGRKASGVHAGTEKLASSKLGNEGNAALKVTSPAFKAGDTLPRSSTADGDGIPPVIAWSGVPEGARSMAIVVEDPDAPVPEPFVHWLVYNVPARDGVLDPATLRAARQGRNSMLKEGFSGAAPPPGHGTHHYHFQVFALDKDLELDPGAGRTALLDAMRGHVVAWGDLVGTYERR